MKVAVTTSYNINESRQYLNIEYINLLTKNGITPVIIPMTLDFDKIDEVIDMCDGVLLTGGVDVNPKRYSDVVSEKVTDICDLRDEVELHVLEKVYKDDKPLLAICRGMQILNVFCNGTLYQDLPSEVNVNHSSCKPYNKYDHEIEVLEGNVLSKITNKKSLMVNSIHHQAIKDLGCNLVVEAKSLDGIIEAISDKTKKFVFGVQFHPDFLFEFDEVSNDIVKYFKSKLNK